MARSFQPDMFDDLTAPALLVEWPMVDGARTLTFDADLPPEVVTAIRARMTSRDDDDQAARANIAALRDAVDAHPEPTDLAGVIALLADIKALEVASACYLLGEG
jgi:hypothetical protein